LFWRCIVTLFFLYTN